MADLLWPGDERAADLLSDRAVLDHLVRVEAAWLAALVGSGLAPAEAGDDLSDLLTADDPAGLSVAAEASGTPVLPLVGLLRERLGTRNAEAARWLHRGLTSQDVLDTALVAAHREAFTQIEVTLVQQANVLVALAEAHRDTGMVARTLTQHAVPTTFGLKVAGWLTGILDALDAVDSLVFPVQVGGAAGTRSAIVELAGKADDPLGVTSQVVADTARTLGLTDAGPWHTRRTPLTRAADAALACTDAWGRLAHDVLTLGRPEIGELREGSGGASSTMPHKANPVLSVLVRRTALTAPHLAATVHAAAASYVDERPDGAWHAEWDPLRTLVRRTVVAGSQVATLLEGLQVDADRMRRTLDSAHDDLRAEQRSMSELSGLPTAASYDGAAGALTDEVLDRARRRIGGRP